MSEINERLLNELVDAVKEIVHKDEAAGLVKLSWQDGVPDFRVLRSLRRDLSGNTTIAGDAVPVRLLDDPGVLRDGNLWYYDVE